MTPQNCIFCTESVFLLRHHEKIEHRKLSTIMFVMIKRWYYKRPLREVIVLRKIFTLRLLRASVRYLLSKLFSIHFSFQLRDSNQKNQFAMHISVEIYGSDGEVTNVIKYSMLQFFRFFRTESLTFDLSVPESVIRHS